MSTGNIIFFSLAFGATFILWRLLVKSQRNDWERFKDSRLDVDDSVHGVSNGFNGVNMYGGDPELVGRVERKLRDASNSE